MNQPGSSFVADALRRVIHPGERLLWHGQPDPSLAAMHPSRSTAILWFTTVVLVGLLALVFLAMSLDPSFKWRDAQVLGPIAVPSVVLLGVLTWMWIAYLRGRSKARRTAYAVTDRRVLTIRAERDGSLSVEDHAAGGLTLLQCAPIKGAHQNLWLSIRVVNQGLPSPRVNGFFAITDADRVAELIAGQAYAASAVASRSAVSRISAR